MDLALMIPLSGTPSISFWLLLLTMTTMSTGVPPALRTSFMASCAVAPVDMTSSTMTTFLPSTEA